jgi:hypothetical protein
VRCRVLTIAVTGCICAALSAGPLLGAPQRGRRSAKSTKSSPSQAATNLKAEVIRTAKDYKVSLQQLLALEEEELTSATKQADRRRDLLSQGIISRRELEDSERAVAMAQRKISDTRKRITECDGLIAEAQAAEQLAKLGPVRPGSYLTTPALIRYSGTSNWIISDVAKIDGFFVGQFHRSLPVSAFGQTPVHDKLGFDHHNSIDVALSPDGSEGRALMSYLRGAGIPFIAFRTAVPGAATGAHIHIGFPSRRINR